MRVRDANDGWPRLLACDMDGTILDDKGRLRAAVKEAIGAVRASGVHVVLATGRSPWAVAPTALALGLTGPQITMNGGAFVSPITGEVAWARRLRPELVRDGLAFARATGASPLLGFVDRIVVEAPKGRGTELPDFATGPQVQRVARLLDAAARGPVRLYIPTEPSDHARVLLEAAAVFGPRASIVYSDDTGIEIQAPGTNKGLALRMVAAAMNVERARVAAIGDGPNDREMLEYAGRAGALTPAPGSALADASIASYAAIAGRVAQVFPSSAEDGAIEALRTFFPTAALTPVETLDLVVAADADADAEADPDADLTAA